MKKNTILNNILVEKLVFWGKWFARLQHENPDLSGKTVFISGGVLPQSVVNVRVLKSRKDYIEGQAVEIVKKSPLETQHPQNPYGIQPGCGRVNIPYEHQLDIKSGQISESLFHIRKLQENIDISPILSSPLMDGYRNKIEWSFGKFISGKYDRNEHFNVWFHKQGEFSKIEDYDGTILISEKLNAIYQDIKIFAKQSGLPVYDQFTGEGFWRHLVMREGFFTGEIMLILSFFPHFPEAQNLDFLKKYFGKLTEKYPEIASVYFSHNDSKADVALGRLECIFGKEYITETLLGLEFRISPKSFFQTNSHGAEVLYQNILDLVPAEKLQDAHVLDLYGGTGTIGMLFAKQAKKVTSVELVESASKDGEQNAHNNDLKNIDFVCDKTENFLKTFVKNKEKADILIIDPPRSGMHPDALASILGFDAEYFLYVSCNPATLSRDLSKILQESTYRIEKMIPVDMFPHTHHIETIVLLKK